MNSRFLIDFNTDKNTSRVPPGTLFPFSNLLLHSYTPIYAI